MENYLSERPLLHHGLGHCLAGTYLEGLNAYRLSDGDAADADPAELDKPSEVVMDHLNMQNPLAHTTDRAIVPKLFHTLNVSP